MRRGFYRQTALAVDSNCLLLLAFLSRIFTAACPEALRVRLDDRKALVLLVCLILLIESLTGEGLRAISILDLIVRFVLNDRLSLLSLNNLTAALHEVILQFGLFDEWLINL